MTKYFVDEREFLVFPHCASFRCKNYVKSTFHYISTLDWFDGKNCVAVKFSQVFHIIYVKTTQLVLTGITLYADFTKFFTKWGQNSAISKFSTIHSVENWMIFSQRFFSSNQVSSSFFCKTITFTKFLPKKCESKFPKFLHCNSLKKFSWNWLENIFFSQKKKKRLRTLFWIWRQSIWTPFVETPPYSQNVNFNSKH